MWFPTKCTDIFGSLSVVTNHSRSAARPDDSRPTRTSGVNSETIMSMSRQSSASA